LPNLVILPAASAIEPEAREARFITLSQQATIDNGIGLDSCWRVIRRHWRMMAALVSLAVIIAGAVVFLLTPQYIAKSTLLIEPEPPQLLDVKELVSASGSTEDHDYYKTQFELLKSRDLAGRVISELDLTHDRAFNSIDLRTRVTNFALALFASLFGGKPEPVSAKDAKTFDRFDIINRYLDGLKIDPVAGTRLVTISYSVSDRRLAVQIVDRHVHDYVQMGIELRAQAGKSARDFLAGQLVEISRRVQDSEAVLNAYRHQKGIVSFGVEEKNVVAAQRMSDLNKTLTDVETKRMSAQAQMILVQAGDYESLPQVIANPVITSLEPEVRRLQAEYARLSASFNLAYPKLHEAKAQMDAAQKALTVEIRNVAKAVQRSYTAADAEEKRLQAEIDAEKAKDLAINDASLRDAVLVREVETNRQLYKNVLQRMQEMEVTEEAPLSNISIFDNAVVSRFPSSPKKLRDIAISALLALFAGIGLAFYADQRDDSLRSIEELEEFLHLPSLAVVPDFSRLGSSVSRRKRLTGAIGSWTEHVNRSEASYSGNAKEYTECYIPGAAETYRMIRTSLLFSRAGSPPRTIIVSSAITGEGKTSTAANTAVAFAQTGASTLLIDADLRRPSCHSLMKEANEIGFSDVLAGHVQLDKAIRPTAVKNLFLLTAGSAVPNPAELLTSDKMRETLTALREAYDITFLDTAPLMLASDTSAMATMVDGVMLVAGAGTPKQSVRRACQRLEYVGAKVFGVVLNRVNIHKPGYEEFSSYYHSYRQYETEGN
jgi:succinoglycan biosynthesis transport protein ExoP